jgi:rhamnulokinase
MRSTSNYIAVDLGASSGRVLLGGWDGERFRLQEIHRFANEPVSVMGHLHWDALRLWAEIKVGLARYASMHPEPPSGIGLDTWGVDFGLLDRAGRLLGNPYCYRDSRTDGTLEQVFSVVPREEIFSLTGIQFMQINTLFQLYSMVRDGDPQLQAASTLLTMPNLFLYWLCGRASAEYTHATTTQCFEARGHCWATGLLKRLDIPTDLLPEIVPPGTVLDELLPGVREETGLTGTAPVIATASHDTASAVAAIPGLDEHSAYISSGTWSLMGAQVSEPVITARAMECNFTNEGGIEGTVRFHKNISGLWLLQECRRQWSRDGREYGWEELLALGDKATPFRSLVDPDSRAFLSPPNMPVAIREYCVASGQPAPESHGEFVRCCLESLALKHRQVLADAEDVLGRRLDTIRIVGGGSQNTLLCRLTADACGRPVIAGPVEATALGNIAVQAMTSGELEGAAAVRQAVAASVPLLTYEPSKAEAASWDDAFDRLRRLSERAC